MKLISVNIERSKHLKRVLPFIEKEMPDVLCLQEVHERDLPQFTALLDEHVICSPMTVLPDEESPSGIAIVSRHPIIASGIDYYRGAPGPVKELDMASVDTMYRSVATMFLWADVSLDERAYRIGTTHFTWTPNGEADHYQRRDMDALIPILERSGELVFAGDFNAPRGGEIFARIAERWHDNIPPQYVTSLDVDLHRAGKTKSHELADKMVDGLFTTSSYHASDVKLVSGVSDHMAIVAHVVRS